MLQRSGVKCCDLESAFLTDEQLNRSYNRLNKIRFFRSPGRKFRGAQRSGEKPKCQNHHFKSYLSDWITVARPTYEKRLCSDGRHCDSSTVSQGCRAQHSGQSTDFMEQLHEVVIGGPSVRVSHATLKTVRHVLYCGRKYKYTGNMSSVPAEVLCDQTIWLEWLQHLVTSKDAEGFGEYKDGTICGYLRRNLWTLRTTHGKKGSTHEQFFQVLSAA